MKVSLRELIEAMKRLGGRGSVSHIYALIHAATKRGVDARQVGGRFDSATSAGKRSVLKTSSVTVAGVDWSGAMLVRDFCKRSPPNFSTIRIRTYSAPTQGNMLGRALSIDEHWIQSVVYNGYRHVPVSTSMIDANNSSGKTDA